MTAKILDFEKGKQNLLEKGIRIRKMYIFSPEEKTTIKNKIMQIRQKGFFAKECNFSKKTVVLEGEWLFKPMIG